MTYPKPRDSHGVYERGQVMGYARPAAASVGVASTTVLASNTKRRKAVFINYSANYIFLGRGTPAVVGQGIQLNPWGGSWEETPDTLGHFWRGEFTAIATGAASPLSIMEDV